MSYLSMFVPAAAVSGVAEERLQGVRNNVVFDHVHHQQRSESWVRRYGAERVKQIAILPL